MKAPDKIYLVRDAVNPEGIFDSVASKKPMFQDDIPYIRKDAILEWAKKRKEQAGIGLSEYDMGHENGICEVIEELIKHIESL